MRLFFYECSKWCVGHPEWWLKWSNWGLGMQRCKMEDAKCWFWRWNAKDASLNANDCNVNMRDTKKVQYEVYMMQVWGSNYGECKWMLCKSEIYVLPSTFRSTSCHVFQGLNVLNQSLWCFDKVLTMFDVLTRFCKFPRCKFECWLLSWLCFTHMQDTLRQE